MTRYLTVEEVLELHRRVIAQSGGSAGLRDAGGLDSAVAQPQLTFGGNNLGLRGNDRENFIQWVREHATEMIEP